MARALLTAAVAVILMCAFPGATGADTGDLNPIQFENSLPGTAAWQARLSDHISVYGTQLSAAPGDSIDFHVSTATRYRLMIYRLGWYGGDGARLMACVPDCNSDEQGKLQPQPGAPPANATDSPIRANWPVTDTLQTGEDWVSGYYLVEAMITYGVDYGRVATTFFIIHPFDLSVGSRILVQVPVNTWEAYNTWGGKSLYDFTGPRMYRVSFERPFGYLAQSPFWWEIQLVRFLERNGYDVSYQTDQDTDANPSSLLQHRLVIDSGHDEYWTSGMRNAWDTALGDGTNLAFMGANEAYWRVDYQDGEQTIFTYKSLYDPARNLADKTAMFREIGDPECEIEADQFQSLAAAPQADYAVTAAGASDPWMAGTGLSAGTVLNGLVSREHDKINPYPISCFHPGLVDLFHYDGKGVDSDADAVKYTAPSGARVFASGSFQFTWALDSWHDSTGLAPSLGIDGVFPQNIPADPRVQEFMENALADLQKPAEPAGVEVVQTGGAIIVTLPPTNDPRIVDFFAGVKTATGWTKLCTGTTFCSASIPADAINPPVVGVVYRDVWHAHSTAYFVKLARHP